MKNTLETRLGIFVALAIIAAVLILETIGGLQLFRPGYPLKADFNTVQDLKIGDRVKMGGVEVGRVEEIGLTNNRVRVTMKIYRDKPVKTDSTATVKFTGLLGQNFVEVTFGSPAAPQAEPGLVLKSGEQPDLSVIMSKIDDVASGVQNLTRSFTGFKVDELVGPLTDFIRANKDPLSATISNMNTISTQISQGHGTVGKLIYDDALYNSALSSISYFKEAASEVKITIADAHKAIDQANKFMEQANSGHGTIAKLLNDDTLYRETTETMRNTKEILEKINQGQGTVGKLITDQEFYRNAKLSLQKLDKATEGLEDQGPLTVLGIITGHLF
jgi:phospholipid/cholesterol/gamma-HCH transport system substrate-binding protein